MEERGLLIQKGRSEGILYWDPFWTQGPVERRMDEVGHQGVWQQEGDGRED